MFAAENETVLRAPPSNVWTAVTHFEDYGRWNPFVRVVGQPTQGAVVAYSFRMKSHKPRFLTVNARITDLEVQRQMTFRWGFEWLLAVEESYFIEPAPGGSRLVHSFCCTGLFSALKLKMRRNFHHVLEIVDGQLQRHLSPARPPHPAKKRVRKGFRPNA